MTPRTRTVLPNIEPILVVAGSPPLHDPRWIYEPKFDGFRGVLYVCRGECYIRSKRSNVLKRFADLARRVQAELDVKDAILDGEVVALDEKGRMDFRALLASRGWLHYAAFDLLWLNGKDLRGQPLIKRKRRLEQLILSNNATLSRVLAVNEHGRELYEACPAAGPRGYRGEAEGGSLLVSDRLVQGQESRALGSPARPLPSSKCQTPRSC